MKPKLVYSETKMTFCKWQTRQSHLTQPAANQVIFSVQTGFKVQTGVNEVNV